MTPKTNAADDNDHARIATTGASQDSRPASELSGKRALADGVFAEIGADGASFVLTAEAQGRTTHRIVLSIAAANAFQEYVAGVRGIAQAPESVKRLRGHS